jgi:hypothetical protein
VIATVSVLTFVTELVRIHQSTRQVDAPAILVAAAITERERWLPLLREVLELEDGVLLDASILGEGVNCGDIENEAPNLTSWVVGILDAYNLIDITANLRLIIEGGRARISGNASYEAANAAQRAMREILTAVCADSLRSAQLATFVFPQDALDGQLLALMWEGLMNLPDRLNFDATSTLAIIAGDGQIDFDVHCTGDPSLRYRINEAGLSLRHTYSRSAHPVKSLGRQEKDDIPLVVMFMGAGASITKGMPLGDHLRNEALSRATGETVDAGTFDSVSRSWFEALLATEALSQAEQDAGVNSFVRGLTLERVLQQEQAEENQTYTATLRRFASVHAEVKAKLIAEIDPNADPLSLIIAARQRLVLLTVNFDQIIEARGGKNLRVFVTEADMLEFPSYLDSYLSSGGKVPLVKLHGDIDLPETLVANLQQTTAGLTVARDAALTSLVSFVDSQPTHPWFYVGYSMRDKDLEQAWAAPRMSTFNEQWVAPFLDPVVDSFIAAKRALSWQRSGRAQSAMDRLISLTAEDFFKEFEEHVSRGW